VAGVCCFPGDVEGPEFHPVSVSVPRSCQETRKESVTGERASHSVTQAAKEAERPHPATLVTQPAAESV
jgi:hypothetical protein